MLAFFAVEHAEIGRVIGYYEGQKTCDREYYMLSELYFAYWALKIGVEKGKCARLIKSIGFVTQQDLGQ